MKFFPTPGIPDEPADYRWPRREPTIKTPPPTQDQTLQREHRRKGLCLQYRSEFDLAREVAEVCGPLAAAVAAMPDPAVMVRRVGEVFDAVPELCVTAVGLVMRSDSSSQHLADLAAKPAPPQITSVMLADGSWSQVLTENIRPLSADLAALLGRALPPNDTRLKGRLAASERLNNALLELDRAAVGLARSTAVTNRVQRQPSQAEVAEQRRRQREQQAVQRRLSRLGVRT